MVDQQQAGGGKDCVLEVEGFASAGVEEQAWQGVSAQQVGQQREGGGLRGLVVDLVGDGQQGGPEGQVADGCEGQAHYPGCHVFGNHNG